MTIPRIEAAASQTEPLRDAGSSPISETCKPDHIDDKHSALAPSGPVGCTGPLILHGLLYCHSCYENDIVATFWRSYPLSKFPIWPPGSQYESGYRIVRTNLADQHEPPRHDSFVCGGRRVAASVAPDGPGGSWLPG